MAERVGVSPDTSLPARPGPDRPRPRRSTAWTGWPTHLAPGGPDRRPGGRGHRAPGGPAAGAPRGGRWAACGRRDGADPGCRLRATRRHAARDGSTRHDPLRRRTSRWSAPAASSTTPTRPGRWRRCSRRCADAASRCPTWCVADHGWAGAAGEAGVTSVGFADSQRPGAVRRGGRGQGRRRRCRWTTTSPPHLYEPMTAYLLPPPGSAALTSAETFARTGDRSGIGGLLENSAWPLAEPRPYAASLLVRFAVGQPRAASSCSASRSLAQLLASMIDRARPRVGHGRRRPHHHGRHPAAAVRRRPRRRAPAAKVAALDRAVRGSRGGPRSRGSRSGTATATCSTSLTRTPTRRPATRSAGASHELARGARGRDRGRDHQQQPRAGQRGAARRGTAPCSRSTCRSCTADDAEAGRRLRAVSALRAGPGQHPRRHDPGGRAARRRPGRPLARPVPDRRDGLPPAAPRGRPQRAPGAARRADRAAQPRLLLRPRRRPAPAAAAPARRSALVLLDLDRFREVNDTLGHRPATSCCARSAARLQRSLRRAGRPGRPARR